MNDDRLWRAVMLRDHEADGLFVYAVTSTGIYCRPSCPSRRPLRDRVRFFPAPPMAEARGFRACRRCHPASAVLPAASTDRVRRACEAIAHTPERRWRVEQIAQAGEATVTQMQRAFKS